MTGLRSRKGFTLIELLIVVVIIGILATILITRFTGVKEAAYVASVNTVAQQVSQACMAYNSLRTDGAICDDITKLQSMADDLAATMDQVTLAIAGGVWTVTHSQIPANTATVNATTGAVTPATP